MAGFMTLQVCQETGISICDPEDGSNYILVPESYRGDCDLEPDTAPVPGLWWAEYSAHGYMDRTDPVSGATALAAITNCFELYGSEDDPAEVAEYNDLVTQIKERGL